LVSTGSGVRVVALGKVEVDRIGVTWSKKQNKVNAKTSTKIGAVKVKAAKGFRFGGSKVAQTEAAFA
jgi:hypothetical protein